MARAGGPDLLQHDSDDLAEEAVSEDGGTRDRAQVANILGSLNQLDCRHVRAAAKGLAEKSGGGKDGSSAPGDDEEKDTTAMATSIDDSVFCAASTQAAEPVACAA